MNHKSIINLSINCNNLGASLKESWSS